MSESLETAVDDDLNLASEALPSDDSGLTTDAGSQVDASQVQPELSQEPAPEPAFDYEAEYARREWIGRAEGVGIDPSRYSPDQLPYVVRDVYRQREQKLAWAEQTYGDPSYQEYLRTRGGAQDATRAQGSAAPPAPEAIDPFQALQQAFKEPTPPAYLGVLAENKFLVKTATGRIEAAPGNPGQVSREELAAINKYAADKQAFDEGRGGEAFQKAFREAARAEANEVFAAARKSEQSEQHIRQAATQDENLVLIPGTTTPTPYYGRAYIQTLLQLEKSGLDNATRVHLARQAGAAALAPVLIQHREQQFQQYIGQLQQPQPSAQAPGNQPAPLPQRTPDTFARAVHSASGNGSPARRQTAPALNGAQIKTKVWGSALAAMPDDPE